MFVGWIVIFAGFLLTYSYSSEATTQQLRAAAA